MTPDDARRPPGRLADRPDVSRRTPAGRDDLLPGAPAARATAPARLGAHRPRRSPLRDVLPLLVVALVVVAVAVGVWRLAGATPSTVAASGGPAAVGPGPATEPTAAGATASTTAAPTTGATSASPSGAAAGTGTPTAAGAPPAPVDRSLPVTVVNATGRTGLAARTATTLRGSGWTALTANATERPAATVVYYPREGLAASARSVAAGLVTGGFVSAAPTTELTQRFGTDRITVLLGADAAPA